METRVEKTQELHDRGYNCAQAVGCAYCDLVGISEDEMFRMLEGYGWVWDAWKESAVQCREQLLWQA